MSDTITMAPAAGWYPDPMDDSAWRWWDGARWSDQVRPKQVETAVPTVTSMPAPSYASEPAYAPEPTYAPEPSYAPEPTYSPEPVYVAEPAYSPQPTQTPEPVFAPQATYVPEPVPVQSPPQPIELHPVAPATPQPATPQSAASQPASEPSAVVPYTHSHLAGVPIASPAPPVTITVSPSAEVVRYDLSSLEPSYPWEAAIAALEAEQSSGSAVSSRASRSREPHESRAVREPRAMAAITARPAEPSQSASTPFNWMLAFSPILAAAIAGALQYFVAPVLLTAGIDAMMAAVAMGAVSLLPIWLIAGLDISSLRRRGFTPPSVLWILLLTPLAYFIARSRAVRRDDASSHGPEIAYLLSLLAVVAAAAAAIVLFLPLITAAGLNPFSPKIAFDPPSTSAPAYQYGIGVQTPQANSAGTLPGGDEALWQQVGTALSASWLDENGGYIDCSTSESIIALGSTFPCFAEKFDSTGQPTGAVTLNVTVDKAGAVSYTEVPAKN